MLTPNIDFRNKTMLITNPDVYIESNLVGFFDILEACRNHPVKHLVYASSSSVYGTNKKVPYSTETVYGPAGGPDMAYFGFKPNTSLREGLRRFAQWYSEFYCCG